MKHSPIFMAFALSTAACASTGSSMGTGKRALTETLAADGRFKTLLKLIEASNVDVPDDAATVFAPTDEAFAKLPPELMKSGLDPANRDKLRIELAFHMADRTYSSETLADLKALETAAGFPLQIKQKDTRLIVGNAIVTTPDVAYGEGVIHVIDAVLRPPTKYLERVKPKTKAPKRVQPDQWWW